MRRLGLAVPVVVGLCVWLGAASAAYSDTISGTCAWGGQSHPCDSTVWYPSALTVVWNASPSPDAVSGCTPQVANHYNSDQITPVSCSATWPGPTPGTTMSITQAYTLHVETSSPTATAIPSRPPDSNGWYNHPVAGATSANSFSGIKSCTSTTYAGPNTTSATVTGTCIDNADKTVSATSAPFAYDVTPPSLTASANTGDRSVGLSWQAGGDIAPVASVSVTRSPGLAHAGADRVYAGGVGGYEDTHVRNGIRYTYTIVAVDQAGNASTQSLVVTPGPRLLAPLGNVFLANPPMLSWTPVRGATYYNVQLYRGGKVLSMWPKHANLQLHHRWRFEGHRYRLKPGKYRWFVWPGFGKRSAARYGHRIGSGTFVVVR